MSDLILYWFVIRETPLTLQSIKFFRIIFWLGVWPLGIGLEYVNLTHTHTHTSAKLSKQSEIYVLSHCFLQVSWLPNVGVFPANINS